MKKLFTTVLVLTIMLFSILSSSIISSAKDVSPTITYSNYDTPEFENPVTESQTSNLNVDCENFGGLTNDDSQISSNTYYDMQKSIYSSNSPLITPAWVPGTYVISSVSSVRTYDGYRDRGEVASGTNSKNENDTLSFTISRTVSNTFSASLGVTKSMVDALVGYDVSWSQQAAWSYQAVVAANRSVGIGYKDCYHTTVLNCKAITYVLGTVLTSTEESTGYADQWYGHEFYSYYK